MSEPLRLFPGFHTRWFTTPGAAIFARVGGDGPPLFLLHGYPQTGAMWHPLAAFLARHYTLIIPDLRGYGLSRLDPGYADHHVMSKRSMAGDIIAMADELGFQRFGVVAHDRGARAAYRLALDHPARVERLALLDIVPTHAMWHGLSPTLALKAFHWSFLAQPAPLPEDMIGRDPLHWLHAMLAGWTARGDLGAFDERALGEYRAAFLRPEVIHATCMDYRAGASFDLADDEADVRERHMITCPTLVVWGKAGFPGASGSPLDIWRDWCENVRGVALDCGHFVVEERVQQTSEALMQFLVMKL
jgi:haloacetate dehalogenase